jgi:hypothetical protein
MTDAFDWESDLPPARLLRDVSRLLTAEEEITGARPPIDIYASCSVHGRMRHDDAMCRWRCAGWDSEGCTALANDEEVHRAASSRSPDDPGETVLEVEVVVQQARVAGVVDGCNVCGHTAEHGGVSILVCAECGGICEGRLDLT